MTEKIIFNRQLLEELMKKNNLNGSQLAREIGVTRASISRVRRGNRLIPESKFILGLAKRFNIPMEDFLITESSLKSNTKSGETANG